MLDKSKMKTPNQEIIKFNNIRGFLKTNMHDTDIIQAVNLWYSVRGDLDKFYEQYDGYEFKLVHRSYINEDPKKSSHGSALRSILRVSPTSEFRKLCKIFDNITFDVDQLMFLPRDTVVRFIYRNLMDNRTTMDIHEFKLAWKDANRNCVLIDNGDVITLTLEGRSIDFKKIDDATVLIYHKKKEKEYKDRINNKNK